MQVFLLARPRPPRPYLQLPHPQTTRGPSHQTNRLFLCHPHRLEVRQRLFLCHPHRLDPSSHIVEELSTGKVLTTEWVNGERLDRSEKDDVTVLCSIAMNTYLTMMLELGTLHR